MIISVIGYVCLIHWSVSSSIGKIVELGSRSLFFMLRLKVFSTLSTTIHNHCLTLGLASLSLKN